MNEIDYCKDCTNCIYFDIETFYGVCNKHCEILNDEKPCEDFEEDNQWAK